VLGLAVFQELVVCEAEFLRKDLIVCGWVEGPEVDNEDHDGEVDIHVAMILFHSFLEGVGMILE
jgi:hypothetical protein